MVVNVMDGLVGGSLSLIHVTQGLKRARKSVVGI